MYIILSALARLIAPIIPFTADEIWKYIPHCKGDNTESVFLNDMPEVSGLEYDEKFRLKWDLIVHLRDDVKKALEVKRAEKVIGSSLDAAVKITVGVDDYYSRLIDGDVERAEKELKDIFIVSKVEICKASDNSYFVIEVKHADGEKCERCWTYSDTVGKSAEHPTLCERCAHTVK